LFLETILRFQFSTYTTKVLPHDNLPFHDLVGQANGSNQFYNLPHRLVVAFNLSPEYQAQKTFARNLHV